MTYCIVAFICGLIFGVGLTISNMIDPNKIMNFLDISGNWDPSLILVMISAVMVTGIGFRLVLRRKKPVLAHNFYMPTNNHIDLRLIFGAMLFGVGWGLSGYCPGPGITALVLGTLDPLYFVLGLILSLIAQRILRIS